MFYFLFLLIVIIILNVILIVINFSHFYFDSTYGELNSILTN